MFYSQLLLTFLYLSLIHWLAGLAATPVKMVYVLTGAGMARKGLGFPLSRIIFFPDSGDFFISIQISLDSQVSRVTLPAGTQKEDIL